MAHASLFSTSLQLSTPEKIYFQTLIEFENAKSPEDKKLVASWLAELNPGASFKVKEITSYQILSEWVHMAILAMTDLKDFKCEPDWIQKRLGKKATILEIQRALERLKEQELLAQDADTGRWSYTHERITTRDDIANEGAKAYFESTSQLAAQSVQTQSVQEREFQGFAISMNQGRMAEAKEMIRKFRTQFAQEFASKNGDGVYHMNLQLFRLTEDADTGFAQPQKGELYVPQK